MPSGIQIFDSQGRLILDTETYVLKQITIANTDNSVNSGSITIPVAQIPPQSQPVISPIPVQLETPTAPPVITYSENTTVDRTVTWQKQRNDIDINHRFRVDMY